MIKHRIDSVYESWLAHTIVRWIKYNINTYKSAKSTKKLKQVECLQVHLSNPLLRTGKTYPSDKNTYFKTIARGFKKNPVFQEGYTVLTTTRRSSKQ